MDCAVCSKPFGLHPIRIRRDDKTLSWHNYVPPDPPPAVATVQTAPLVEECDCNMCQSLKLMAL